LRCASGCAHHRDLGVGRGVIARRVASATLHTVMDGVVRSRPASSAAGTSPLVVWCGRLQQWKGPHHFIEAAQVVHRAMPTARFALVGGTLFGIEPEYAAVLRAHVEAAGLGDALLFVGHVDDARPWMRAAAVVVHSSDRPEPFGLVMAEAMMQERPVAAFRHGGAAEIVLDGVTGRLVAPGDAPALGRAVLDLLSDGPLARTLGLAGRARALQYFDADVMTASVAGVYDLVAASA
jgi:glycosyltransferase involved in cell wall biosynthesis